jgi:superfamily II DNA helicase RecQ
MALSGVYRFQQQGGQRFGAVHLIDVLRGKATEKVAQFGHEGLSTFGIGAAIPEAQWRAVLRQLIALGHLRSDGEYNTLALTETSRQVLRGEVALLLREAGPAEPRAARGRSGRGTRAGAASGKPAPRALDAAGLERFAALKAWRAEVAKAHNLPRMSSSTTRHWPRWPSVARLARRAGRSRRRRRAQARGLRRGDPARPRLSLTLTLPALLRRIPCMEADPHPPWPRPSRPTTP